MNRSLARCPRVPRPGRVAAHWAIVAVALGLLAACGQPSATTDGPTRGNAAAAAAPSSSASSSAAAGSRVRLFQLVTAMQGWVVTDQQLLWLSHDGRQRTDITPGGIAVTAIRGVFFRDVTHGWVVASGTPDPARGTPLDVYRTSDGGQTWQRSSLAGPDPVNTDATSRPAYIDFVDPQYGWVMARQATNVNFSAGDLYQTTDGGATWTKLSLPIGGSIRFMSRSDGWTAGGALNDRLYVTRDGGQTWERQAVTLPPDYTANAPAYDLPTFQDNRTGVLPVSFTGADRGAIGFYVTGDGGRTWSLAATIPSQDRLERGVALRSEIVDTDTWLVASFGGGRVDRTRDRGRTVETVPASGLPNGVAKIDFATADVGWSRTETTTCSGVKTGCSTTVQLLRTTNSGQSWQPIAP